MRIRAVRAFCVAACLLALAGCSASPSSFKLGSSLTEALRVYSDDMRHQRLSRAEEKAYSLPAKLSVPLTLCVFPVVIIVIMLPVYVRFKVGAY